MLNTPIISIVDDDDTVRLSLDSLVRSMGYAARGYACAEDYLACNAFDLTACLISDIQMPGMSGFQLFEELQKRAMRYPVIFITAGNDDRTELMARKLGAAGYFNKPFNAELLMKLVNDVIDIKTSD